jgi:hypothetical protein
MLVHIQRTASGELRPSVDPRCGLLRLMDGSICGAYNMCVKLQDAHILKLRISGRKASISIFTSSITRRQEYVRSGS